MHIRDLNAVRVGDFRESSKNKLLWDDIQLYSYTDGRYGGMLTASLMLTHGCT